MIACGPEFLLRKDAETITYSPCPLCGCPIASNEVARAGYEADDMRHPMMRYGRGAYCDHIMRQE